MSDIINHPYTHPCVSDGGAHIRYQTVGTWPVTFLAKRVRDQQMMSLEKATTRSAVCRPESVDSLIGAS